MREVSEVLSPDAFDPSRSETTDRQTDSGSTPSRYRVGEDGGKLVSIGRPRRVSFKEAIAMAEDQISLREYSRRHACWGILHDMCRAMAEVYMMNPAAVIKIDGEELEAGMVAEVLREVSPEMAESLAEDLQETIADVKCVKAYLRSALYIKVFEFEACAVRLSEQVKRETG